jgi:hypothetical protein
MIALTVVGVLTLDVSAGGTAQGDVAYGSAAADGAATSDWASDFYHFTLSGSAGVEARGGTVAPLAAHAEGEAFLGDLPTAGVESGGLFVTTVDASADAGGLPALDARRDVHRGAYSDAAASFEVVGLRGTDGRHLYTFLEAGVGNQLSAQDGIVHTQQTMHAAFVRGCKLRARPAPDRCVVVLPFDAIGVTGGSEAAVGDFYLADLSGLGLGGGVYLDASLGFGATGTMTTEENGQVTSVITTDDLPDVGAAVGHLAVHTAHADVSLARQFYVTLDGDLALDDRATVEARWSSYTARAFAARTRWWTSKSDRGHKETTGGVELGTTRVLRWVEVAADVGAARTFYGALDGASADEAGLAGTASVTLKRHVKVVTW